MALTEDKNQIFFLLRSPYNSIKLGFCKQNYDLKEAKPP